MNKFMKTAAILLVLAFVTFTVYRLGTKKSGDVSTTEVTQLNAQKDANGNLVDQNGHEMAGVGTNAGAVNATSGNGGEQNTQSTENGEKGDAVPKVKFGAAQAPKAEGSLSDKLNQPTFTQTKPESNCFSFEYKHEKEALNKDIEDFLDYSNAFPIFHDKVTEKSICVKVNDKAVPFKVSKYKNQKEIVVGSVVGPEATIKVSYCVNTSKCKEACAVKSNRFMDDLMSDTGDENEFKESWGDAKAQKKALQAGVKEFRKVASENRDLQKQSTIRSWDTVQKNEWVCNK